ncbi:MAG: hypothetical protein BWY17_05378 [Deltaproteobacteria bacterium ADurb.Bin207]|nr:MAG: hypothetical protein BWY17_05378 [Deltaproteobacteria bacterium ADurb.Bin207]
MSCARLTRNVSAAIASPTCKVLSALVLARRIALPAGLAGWFPTLAAAPTPSAYVSLPAKGSVSPASMIPRAILPGATDAFRWVDLSLVGGIVLLSRVSKAMNAPRFPTTAKRFGSAFPRAARVHVRKRPPDRSEAVRNRMNTGYAAAKKYAYRVAVGRSVPPEPPCPRPATASMTTAMAPLTKGLPPSLALPPSAPGLVRGCKPAAVPRGGYAMLPFRKKSPVMGSTTIAMAPSTKVSSIKQACT